MLAAERERRRSAVTAAAASTWEIWQVERLEKALALPDIVKVGPEGYIHGFICVRPPCGKGNPGKLKRTDLTHRRDGGVVDKKTGYSIGHVGKNDAGKFEASHADGHVSKHGDKETAIRALMSYHNRNHGAGSDLPASDAVKEPKVTPAEAHAQLADAHAKVAQDYQKLADDHAALADAQEQAASEPADAAGQKAANELAASSSPAKTARDISNADLAAADKELARRATALGKPGQVARHHKAVKSEIARRNGVADEDFAGPHHTFPITDQKSVGRAASMAHHGENPDEVRANIKSIAERKFPGMKMPLSLAGAVVGKPEKTPATTPAAPVSAAKKPAEAKTSHGT